MTAVLNLARGEIVVVRSEQQILATLDEHGELEGLPFMPEMFRFCGQQLAVDRRADKTCDTISGEIRARRMRNAVHLADARCNGAGHGGCQADCLIYWKEAWLERVEAPKVHPLWCFVAETEEEAGPVHESGSCSRTDVERAAIRSSPSPSPTGETAFRCQTTQLLEATSPLSAWSVSQYLRDWLSGNVRLGYILQIATLRLSRKIVVWGRGFKLKVRLYDALARAYGEPPWPFYPGRLTGRTPIEHLGLQPGELVTVKSHEEIRETLNGRSNRGMDFTAEMVRYCGGTYRVRARVEKILDERSGEMLEMKNDCIILEGVVCQSECSSARLFCPRAIYPYWREIWLRRADPADEPT